MFKQRGIKTNLSITLSINIKVNILQTRTEVATINIFCRIPQWDWLVQGARPSNATRARTQAIRVAPKRGGTLLTLAVFGTFSSSPDQSSMLLQAFLFYLISISHVSAASPDIVAAIADISQAVAAGRHLATELTTHVSTEEARLTKLRQLIQRLDSALEIYSPSEKDQSTSSVTGEETTANPVSAFQIILRLASNWSSELSAILEVPNVGSSDAEAATAANKEFDSKMRLFSRLKWYFDMLPDDNDVQGALNAVFRLQQTYNISSIDIAEGRVLPSSSSPRLTGKLKLPTKGHSD